MVFGREGVNAYVCTPENAGPDGGTGRRVRLKIWYWQQCAGSIPVLGTRQGKSKISLVCPVLFLLHLLSCDRVNQYKMNIFRLLRTVNDIVQNSHRKLSSQQTSKQVLLTQDIKDIHQELQQTISEAPALKG